MQHWNVFLFFFFLQYVCIWYDLWSSKKIKKSKNISHATLAKTTGQTHIYAIWLLSRAIKAGYAWAAMLLNAEWWRKSKQETYEVCCRWHIKHTKSTVDYFPRQNPDIFCLSFFFRIFSRNSSFPLHENPENMLLRRWTVRWHHFMCQYIKIFAVVHDAAFVSKQQQRKMTVSLHHTKRENYAWLVLFQYTLPDGKSIDARATKLNWITRISCVIMDGIRGRSQSEYSTHFPFPTTINTTTATIYECETKTPVKRDSDSINDKSIRTTATTTRIKGEKQFRILVELQRRNTRSFRLEFSEFPALSVQCSLTH